MRISSILEKRWRKRFRIIWKNGRHIIPLPGHEDALFLSMQNRRLTVRSVENLVKKYASRVTTVKKITPHKLRSTYGTTLYQETGDIYLVADVLGHKDVNTTRKHYAAMKDENKRKAAKTVRLREDYENRGCDSLIVCPFIHLLSSLSEPQSLQPVSDSGKSVFFPRSFAFF